MIPSGTEPYLRESATPINSIAMSNPPKPVKILAITRWDPLFDILFPQFPICQNNSEFNGKPRQENLAPQQQR